MINILAKINIDIRTVDVNGNVLPDYCGAFPSETFHMFNLPYAVGEPTDFNTFTYNAVDVALPDVGGYFGTCEITDGSDILQPQSDPFCPYSLQFGVCGVYTILQSEGLDNSTGGSYDGVANPYTHHVNVTYIPPTIYGCTDETACNYNPYATNESACNAPQTQVDYTGALCGTNGC